MAVAPHTPDGVAASGQAILGAYSALAKPPNKKAYIPQYRAPCLYWRRLGHSAQESMRTWSGFTELAA